ncbi:AraC family transcriptional regulator [Acinetobacter rathckeae]|uniref:AraC family transcriptional regulator n=1 Tax=Acinetobacter rathckeae TaxID=2605272 RepID=UPI0018A2E444|nr:helix-turn-helix transcriptional regulator [Acinetobacter rathckeae]MBF7687639.1 helix-turn-helix transcriptional regulator [Acinetobacter rathckeae]MBF7695041.1 helix-turn-helix transcriptional regulator [Acinetobacter rathckeae]
MHYFHGQLNYPVYAYAQSYNDGYSEGKHRHDRIQLLHTLSGVIHVKTDEGIWVIPPTRGIWIPEGKAHSITIHGNVEARGVFIDSLARADLSAVCSVVAIPKLLSELINQAVHISDEILPHTRDERLLQLILDEIRFLEEVPFRLPEPQSAVLKSICTYILTDLSVVHHLDHIAKQYHVSSKTLARLFQKEMNMSFTVWLTQAKLLKALTDLESKKPILNIAFDLGYESSSAFSYMFKREMGLTPTAYLKKSHGEVV